MSRNFFLIIIVAHYLCPEPLRATDVQDEKQARVEYQACLASSEDFTAEKIAEAVSAGKVYYGMPAAALRISFGKPLKIVHVENINGQWERWVYPNHEEEYVADGVVIRSPYVYGGSFPTNLVDDAKAQIAKVKLAMTFKGVEKVLGEDWKYYFGANWGMYRTAFYKNDKMPAYEVKTGFQYAGRDVMFGTVTELPELKRR